MIVNVNAETQRRKEKMRSEYIKTNAIVISREDLRTSSLKLHVHTTEAGRIFVQIKGFYKNKVEKHTMLSPGTVLELVYLLPKNNETGLIKEMDIITVPDIHDAIRLTIVHHFIEFLKNIQTTNKREHDALYKLYLSLIEIIQDDKALVKIESILFIHELMALHVLGFLPEIDRCSLCNAEFIASRNIFFSLKENFISCKKCSNVQESLALSPKVIEIIGKITSQKITPKKLKEIVSVSFFSNEDVKKLHLIVRSIIQNVCNVKLKSERFVEEMLNPK